VVKLYLDGVQIGVTSTLSAATTWSINSPFTYSLYPGGTLTVTAQSTGAAEKPGCNNASISCTSPTSPSASPTSSTINTGGTVTYTVADVVANTWYAIMDNSGASYATSQYSSSTSNLSFTTSAFSTPGTYNLKISADQLSGCAPSYIAATVLVNSTVLPVRFVSTTAKKINSQVMVEWSVADEMDVRNYVVERSYDCINFEAVATVNYHAPASVTNKYSFTDNGQGSNKICYRIKQLDVNGNYLYSSIVSVAGTVPKAQIQPNPFLQSIAVNTFLPSAQPIKIQLLDMSGRLIRYKSVPGVSGANKIEFDDLGGLQPGMYMVRIITIDSITERKLIKANP
jgi:plastocyanin